MQSLRVETIFRDLCLLIVLLNGSEVQVRILEVVPGVTRLVAVASRNGGDPQTLGLSPKSI